MATTYTEQEQQVIADCVSNKRTTLKAAFKKAARLLHRKPASIASYYYSAMKPPVNGMDQQKPARQARAVTIGDSPLLNAVRNNALRLAKLLVDQLSQAENLALFEYMLQKERLGTETTEKPTANPAPLQ